MKLFAPISLTILSLSFTTLPKIEGAKGPFTVSGTNKSLPYKSKRSRSIISAIKASVLYNEIKLEEAGLSESAFQYAYEGYQNLLEKNKLSNPDYLTICDFSQSSKKKRFYLIDMKNKEILINTYVAHGRNSGFEYATKFSNKPTSRQSSLGFYVTGKTYYGGHGLALIINGMEPGINNNAARRRIVMHGSKYVGDNYLEMRNYTGRSFGCPAIPQKINTEVINTIKNGSCLFIYHPDKKYLKGSKILNG